jgi:hypothetical protein
LRACTLSQYRTKLLLMSHNFSNVKINSTILNEAHYLDDDMMCAIMSLLGRWPNLQRREMFLNNHVSPYFLYGSICEPLNRSGVPSECSDSKICTFKVISLWGLFPVEIT